MKKKKNTAKQYYTVDERIRRVWAAEEIKNLMSRRSFLVTNDMRREELNKLWVREPKHRKTASLGSNWGYYVGMDDISNFYVVKFDEDRKEQLRMYCETHPEVENCFENQGIGCYNCHPLSTPLVVISGDGETAKGIWYSIGHDCFSDGQERANCRWSVNKYAADFVLEDGEWKIWHLIISNDMNLAVGANADDLPTKPAPGTFIPENDFLAGDPTIKMLTHNSAINWSDRYPPEPEDYFHFSDEVSYGPEGHPNYED